MRLLFLEQSHFIIYNELNMDKKNIIFIGLVTALVIPLLLINPNEEHGDKSPATKRIQTKQKKSLQERKRINLKTYRVINRNMDQVPETIKPLFKFDNKQDCLQFVYKLSKDLSEIERDALYMFLRNDENDSANLHVKDELMCRLEMQTTRPSEYEKALYSIMKDDTIDGDLRGYAVQHLRSAYDVDGTDETLIKEALYQALEETQSDVSGTAMLAFAEFTKRDNANEEFEIDFIKQRALELAADESLHTPSRNTIIECCGRLEIPEIIPVAKEVIGDETKTIADKLPAIAAIGYTGDESHLTYLESLAGQNSIKPAVVAAIKKINKRLNSSQ